MRTTITLILITFLGWFEVLIEQHWGFNAASPNIISAPIIVLAIIMMIAQDIKEIIE
jgi:hypothetical protein